MLFGLKKTYYAEIGLNWSEPEEKKLVQVGKQCIVFGREKKGDVVVREVSTDGCSVKIVDNSGPWSSLRNSGKKLDTETPPVGVTVLAEDTLVVRQISNAGEITVPPEFHVSSSHVRSRITELRKSTTQTENLVKVLHTEFEKILPSAVVDYIVTHGLYTV